MYEKKFDQWNEAKQHIHLHGSNVSAKFYVNPGEIWYVKLGVNVGFEQDGKNEFRRPVLVISRIGSLFFVIPLTTKEKPNNPYYYTLVSHYFDKSSVAILSQCRVLDKNRFIDKIGGVSAHEMLQLQKKLQTLYLPAL